MAAINPQAQALNDTIQAANPAVLSMLSERGRGIFFPTKGILGQTAEAKGKKINATIGIALEDDGSPLRLDCIAKRLDLPAGEAFPYAPSFGLPALRATWQKMIYQKNPSLSPQTPISLPNVACALTHSLSMCGYLFVDHGDTLVLPDYYWGNYKLIFDNAYGAQIATFNTYTEGGFDVAAMKQALLDAPGSRKLLLLNFPNNPTGYTCTDGEAAAIVQALVEVAEAGNDIVVLIDDAYFGLVYEAGIYTESLFAPLATAHEHILAVKIDGATKEDYVWGFRVGFITYAIKGGTPELLAALADKTGGAVRGNISNAPMPSQSLMLHAYTDPAYPAQKQQKYELLKLRANRCREILESHPEYVEQFTALPFNSGYFMCVKLKNADPEVVRQILLRDFSTGVIAASGVVRLAYSATPTDLLPELFENVYQACRKASA